MSNLGDPQWDELLKNFEKGIQIAIDRLEQRNVENIPGAKEALLNRLNNLKRFFPRNEGELFIRTIDNTIQNTFFPNTRDFSEAFEKILQNRTHEQDFIINELVSGFVTSKSKALVAGTTVPIIDRMVEAFSKSIDFQIVDHQFYAMFGDPNKPRKYVKNHLDEIVNLFGMVSREKRVEKDVRRSEEKIYTYYTFPDKILEILKRNYLKKNEETGYKYISEDFDRNVFISLFLANLAVNRDNQKIGGSYTINGICAIFSLILLLALMPAIDIKDDNPLRDNRNFNPNNMKVIPKSWMMKNILEPIFEPLIKIISYRLGGSLWLSEIIDSEVNKKIHNQIRFLIKDVNKWVLGNLCRVEIPIFIEISNIFVEITPERE